VGIEFVGGFESTYLPAHDRDVFETSGHATAWAQDVELLRSAGVRRLRYPVRWHRVEPSPGAYDWRVTDATLGHLRECGMGVIVDLVHHTSYPAWLTDGFADTRFGTAYLRFCEAFAARYPWTREYTLFNEPFSTLFLAGHEAIWPPYGRGMADLVRLFRNVLPAVAEAGRMYADALPDARHVYVDTCERHTGEPGQSHRYATMANDRRFFVVDALLGRDLDPQRPFVRDVLAAGGEDLLDIAPLSIDVLGLDYYAHCQWHFTDAGGVIPSPHPPPLASLIVEYADRYGLLCMLSETNLRGYASDRASWLRYTLEQCELAEEAGVDIDGYCWFPAVDSCDWDSLLFRCDGNVDPVGVWWVDRDGARRGSSMSRAYALAAGGAPAAELPAYRFRKPVSDWLRGYLPQLAHWQWRPPPEGEGCSQTSSDDDRIEFRIADVQH
jgi:beta-glucosidase/6-phospho-beta-glucosidase/beta-galactosidase